MINVDNLTFAYGENQIFKKLNLKIDGDVNGLIGQNGAGKSTLVKLITGLLRPETGAITVDGLDHIDQRRAVLSKLGVMYEDSKYPPWATLREHLRFIGQLRGMDPIIAEKEGVEILERFGIGDKSDEKFQKLSAGMKQKFGIAQALLGDPEYVILDEPTANLDVRARVQILEYIQDLAYEKGMKFLILSHILHDLERICDKVIVLHNGKIMKQSSMKDILDKEFVKTYSIRFSDSENLNGFQVEIEKKGFTCTSKGLNLLIDIKNKEQLNQLRTLTKSEIKPVRSVLEQLFIDLTGGEEY